MNDKFRNQIWSLCVIFMAFYILIGTTAAASSVKLTSVTLDPEDPTGKTTNAPGAWSTNLLDSLTQLGIKDDTGFLNQGSNVGFLGEISIPLENGVHTFTLIGTNLPADYTSNLYYGAVLFFDGVVHLPQIAVYNLNGGVGPFLVQPPGTQIIGSANGGWFFDSASGSSVYIAPDGTKVEVLSFTIDTSGTSDEVSGPLSLGHIGPDGYPDTIAKLTLKVTPPEDPSIPEFPSIVLPVTAILGLIVIFGRRKNMV